MTTVVDIETGKEYQAERFKGTEVQARKYGIRIKENSNKVGDGRYYYESKQGEKIKIGDWILSNQSRAFLITEQSFVNGVRDNLMKIDRDKKANE